MVKTYKQNLINNIPITLVLFRALLGPLIIATSYIYAENARLVIVCCCILAIVSDIYDGILARKLKVATEALRLYDCYADLVFWISACWCIWVLHPSLVKSNWLLVSILIIQEPISDIIYLIKFKKDGCSHTYISKFWGISLVSTFVLIFAFESYISFVFCIIIGIISQWERIAIALILPARICDIPTFYHAWQIKNGIPIKRNKLFHGDTEAKE